MCVCVCVYMDVCVHSAELKSEKAIVSVCVNRCMLLTDTCVCVCVFYCVMKQRQPQNCLPSHRITEIFIMYGAEELCMPDGGGVKYVE